MTAADPTDLRAIAYLVGRLRPDWDQKGIMAELTKATASLEDITRAAVDAATTASTLTPGGIGARLRGDGWTSDLAPKPKKPWEQEAFYGPMAAPCPSCREWVGPGEAHTCQRGRASNARAAYEAIKAGLHRTPEVHVPPETNETERAA